MRFDSFLTGLLFLVVFSTFCGVALIFLYKKSNFLKFKVPSEVSSTKSKLSKPLLWGILIILLVLLFWMDFVRDYTFKNLNWQMSYLYATENGAVGLFNFTDSFMERILGTASSETVYYLKYVMTLTFSILYFTLTTVILKLIFRNQRIVPYTFLFYTLSFCLMSLMFIVALFPFSYETATNFYLISMEIGHLTQSSLPTLLFIVVFKMQSKIAATSKD